jgi:hypothetical protein
MDSARSNRGLKIAVVVLGLVAAGLTVALILVASSGSSDDADNGGSATRKAPCAVYLSNDGDPGTRDGNYDPDVTLSGTLLPMDDPGVPADTSNCAVITEHETQPPSPSP